MTFYCWRGWSNKIQEGHQRGAAKAASNTAQHTGSSRDRPSLGRPTIIHMFCTNPNPSCRIMPKCTVYWSSILQGELFLLQQQLASRGQCEVLKVWSTETWSRTINPWLNTLCGFTISWASRQPPLLHTSHISSIKTHSTLTVPCNYCRNCKVFS